MLEVARDLLSPLHVRGTTDSSADAAVVKTAAFGKTSAADFSFGPTARLKRRSEISHCKDNGEKVYSKHFLLLICDSLTSESRLAIAVTTKVDKRAVARNLVKRRVRELFRLNRHRFARTLDMLVVARRDVQSCTFADYRREILGALSAKGYLKPQEP